MENQLHLKNNCNLSNRKNSGPKGLKYVFKNKKSQRRRSFGFLDLIAFLLILALVLGAIITIKDYIQYKSLRFALPYQGELEETAEARGIVIRPEYLLKAPAPGYFQPVVIEGQRVVSGAVIGYMIDDNGKKTPLKALKAGIVLFETDGNEERLKSAYLDKTDLDLLFRGIAIDNQAPALKDNYAKGRPVAKIIDNLLDSIVILKLDKSIFLPEGESLSFYLDKSTSCLKGCISGTLESADYKYLVLNIPSKEEILFYKRFFEAKIITKKYSGCIIPCNALIYTEEGQAGVLCKGGKRVIFKPVDIIGLVKEEAAVKGLGDGEEIILNSEMAKIGQRLY